MPLFSLNMFSKCIDKLVPLGFKYDPQGKIMIIVKIFMSYTLYFFFTNGMVYGVIPGDLKI